MRTLWLLLLGLIAAPTVWAQRLDLYPARAGQKYELRLSMYVAGEGPFSFRVESPDTLPQGFSLDSNTAVLAGTPGSGDRDYAFTVVAVDVHGTAVASTDYLLHVSTGVPTYRPIVRAQPAQEVPAAIRTRNSASEVARASLPMPEANRRFAPPSTFASSTDADATSAGVAPAAPAAASTPAPANASVNTTQAPAAGSPAPANPADSTQPTFLADWGRVRAYFTGGAVLSHERDQFSKTDVFVAFDLDKNWHTLAWNKGATGFNTFFETRLTAVPVASTETTTTNGAAPAPPTLDSVIASRKSAVLQVGGYLPIVLSTWRYGGAQANPDRNGLFIAPIVKTGFITPTDPSAQVQQQTSSTTTITTPVSPAHFYNFMTGGVRLGHYKWIGSDDPNCTTVAEMNRVVLDRRRLAVARQNLLQAEKRLQAAKNDSRAQQQLTQAEKDRQSAVDELADAEKVLRTQSYVCDGSEKQAPELISHIDFGWGRFSNLEVLTGTGNTMAHHRLGRLQAEGLLKVPGTPLDVGFSANLGLTHVKNETTLAKDDLRFFFGTHFDIGQLVDKIRIGNEAKNPPATQNTPATQPTGGGNQD